MAHNPPPAATLAGTPDDVEAKFYEALHKGDIERLMALWADDDEIVCIHPGGPRLVGAQAIRASFEAIFAHGGVQAQPVHLHRVQWLGGAVHHLVERIVARGGESGRTAFVLATNVYLKTAQGWRLAAHHASPGQDTEPPSAGSDGPTTLH